MRSRWSDGNKSELNTSSCAKVLIRCSIRCASITPWGIHTIAVWWDRIQRQAEVSYGDYLPKEKNAIGVLLGVLLAAHNANQDSRRFALLMNSRSRCPRVRGGFHCEEKIIDCRGGRNIIFRWWRFRLSKLDRRGKIPSPRQTLKTLVWRGRGQ